MAGVRTSSVRVDRPPEGHARRGRHAVEHGACANLVETGLERLWRVEAAHHRLVAITRQAPLLLSVEREVAPSHEHMFAYAAAGTPRLLPPVGTKAFSNGPERAACVRDERPSLRGM